MYAWWTRDRQHGLGQSVITPTWYPVETFEFNLTIVNIDVDPIIDIVCAQ